MADSKPSVSKLEDEESVEGKHKEIVSFDRHKEVFNPKAALKRRDTRVWQKRLRELKYDRSKTKLESEMANANLSGLPMNDSGEQDMDSILEECDGFQGGVSQIQYTNDGDTLSL